MDRPVNRPLRHLMLRHAMALFMIAAVLEVPHFNLAVAIPVCFRVAMVLMAMIVMFVVLMMVLVVVMRAMAVIIVVIGHDGQRQCEQCGRYDNPG